MEQEHSYSNDGNDGNDANDGYGSHKTIEMRRATLVHLYTTLPVYGSDAFWQAVEETAQQKSLPLEVLVRCVRYASTCGDEKGRNRLISIIIQRTSAANEYWARCVLQSIALRVDDDSAYIHDLCADLYERLIRALIDPTRTFWEENFQHCLRLERKHVYYTYMRHEGWWHDSQVDVSNRIPRLLIDRLNMLPSHDPMHELSMKDEAAEQALRTVEQPDLPRLVLHLPDKLKPIIWLLFWEERTEKDTAILLGITDRTVRNRLHAALRLLHRELEPERTYIREQQ